MSKSENLLHKTSVACEPDAEWHPATDEFLASRFVEEGVEGKFVILVVEDDPADRALIALAFEECLDTVDLRFAIDVEEASDYLLRRGQFAETEESPRPSLVLLDLGLPREDGCSVLSLMKGDAKLRKTPVVVFTGSSEERDVARAYDLGANSYFTKPASIEGYRHLIRVLETYWLRRVELPREA